MTQFRVIVGLVAALVFVSLIGAVLHYRGSVNALALEKAAVQAELATAKATNEDNQKTIERITAMREVTDQILKNVSVQLEAINNTQAETTAALTELKTNDTDARTFLNTPIPDSVKRLLNK